MKKALFAALASVVMLGASCSVQDFAPVVLDKPTITASLSDAPQAEITTIDELEDLYGKYSFRYGYLSDNLFDGSWSLGYINNSGAFVSSSGARWVSSAIYCRGSNITTNFPSWDNCFAYREDGTYIGTCSYSSSGGYWYIDSSNAYFVRFQTAPTFSLLNAPTHVMVNKGHVAKVYAPYALGMSYETPLSGARSATYFLDANGDINDRLVYSDNDAYPELRNFEVYFNNLHWMLDDNTYEAFSVSLSEALANATMRNIDGFDYDRDGWYDVMWTVENPYDAYLEFEVGSPLPEKYKDTMLDGLESLYYSLSDGTTTKTGYLTPSSTFYDAMDGLLPNGLLDIQGFKSWLINRQDVSFSGGVEMQLDFDYGLNGKELGAAPVYVDNKSYAATDDMALMPMVSAMAAINLGNRWTCFQLNLNSTYAGYATGYSNAYSTINDETYYRELHIFTPRNQSANELRYVGVLSSYARGYADGVASRDGEVDDLTEQILGLQEDLEQYQGKSYEQIYNIGYQAALNSDVSGAATFNSLFGNILTAPLTILNGLTDISFFGMPILTAILSLLMVAMALFLFKRFK